MVNINPQVQAVRPVSKVNLDSPTITSAPTVHFDCHSNPATGKSFVLWDDIRVVFTDALYLRHESKMIPFMKDADWVTLKPLRIAAIPDVVLDVVVDRPLVRLEATLQQTTLTDTLKEAAVQDTPQEDTALNTTTTDPVSNAPRHNPVYGFEDIALDNNSLLDDPGVRPKLKIPHFVPTAEKEEDADEAILNASNINTESVYDNAQSTNNKPPDNYQRHQAPQDHTATAAVRDISPIVFKASLGDAKSQVKLGDMYRTGDGVEQDFNEARYWYLKAADQGNPAGQCNLGHLYRLELGVDRNHSTALSWYKKAAYQGDADGQCYVGLVHELGLVGAVDYSAAMDWYMMAANQGHAYAQCCIGDLYAGGQGVQHDDDKAKEWYLRSANQGHPLSQLSMGCMHLSGERGSPDDAIVLDWFSKAASRKDVDFWSQMAMGLMYAFGLGVPESDSTAFGWFLKAAHQGLPDAQYTVGKLYYNGLGTPQDYSKALPWLIKSALGNPNDSKAQYEIGSIYLQGLGVPKDYSMAKKWFAKAAKLGHEGARTELYKAQKMSTGAIKATLTPMVNIEPQVQAVRPVSKDNLDSPTTTPSSIVYFNCHSNPATGENFVLWDDILLVFADALYVRHEATIVPFMKDAELIPLKPLRIAAIPDVVLAIVVGNSLVRQETTRTLEATLQETTIADTPKEATVQETHLSIPQEDITLKATTTPVYNAPRRNPVDGMEEMAMENYSHIPHPDSRPKPRAPQSVPTTEQEGNLNEATPNISNIDRELETGNAQFINDKPVSTFQSHRSPQVHTVTAAVRDISSIVVKATLGDAKSQVELGDIHRTGDGVEQDFQQARYWYLKAANQDDPSGQCNLGHLYRLELGVDRNHSTALSWYQKAAARGDAGGQCYVGLVYKDGLTGVVDYSAAMEWYLMAANQGYAYAQYSIGNLYARGRGVHQDDSKAMEWYLRAAEQGLPAAQFKIGFMHLDGTGGSRDKNIALDWFSKAVTRKDTDVWSQIAMAYMYFIGIGVPKSNNTAFSWFLMAARQGSPSAQYFVGMIYRDGKDVPQDYSEALVWFTKSASHNDADAQHEIGLMYLRGQGVPKNYLTAKEWFVKAAKFGCKAADTSLSKVQQLIDEDEEYNCSVIITNCPELSKCQIVNAVEIRTP
ncbi:hypothetical protein F5H01DRAFT_393684 [Linnemannia elongata]|nr:hypothetical protein F5H01DRAFT_393684 [Linnemannia elongata]